MDGLDILSSVLDGNTGRPVIRCTDNATVPSTHTSKCIQIGDLHMQMPAQTPNLQVSSALCRDPGCNNQVNSLLSNGFTRGPLTAQCNGRHSLLQDMPC
jgi:hypothetical protein